MLKTRPRFKRAFVISFCPIMSQQQEQTFDNRVEMVWFRDIGIYNLRAVPTPIGFFSFRELLFIGIGAALTVAGIAVFWGNMIGEIISLFPLGFMFYFAKMKRIKMLPLEVLLLAPLLLGAGRKKVAKQGAVKKEKAATTPPLTPPTVSNAMHLMFSENRPHPAQLNFVIPLTGKEPKPIILFFDGQEVEGTKTSPSRIDDAGAHYTLNFVPDATDIGSHKAQVRFVGSTVPIEEFPLEVRGEAIKVGGK
jgi:hypothetical protein